MTELPSEGAWSRFLVQHQQKQSIEAFVKSFYGPMDRLHNSYIQLMSLRSIDAAQGKQLDGVGQIVGVVRLVEEGVYADFFGFESQPAGRAFGVARIRQMGEQWAFTSDLPDNEYRTLIKAKIALNTALGGRTDLVEATKVIFKINAVFAQDEPGGSVTLFIGRIPDVSDPAWRLFSKLLPRAAGVEIVPSYWDSTLTQYPAALRGTPT